MVNDTSKFALPETHLKQTPYVKPKITLFSYLKVKGFWFVIDINGTFMVGPPQTVDKSQIVGHFISEISVKKLVYV